MSGIAIRSYQARTIDAYREYVARGATSVLVVAPTGAGKTAIGAEIVADAPSVLWIAHTRELVDQAAARLRSRCGARAVGVIMPGVEESPSARIQVSTAQTMLARGTAERGDFALLVLDEAHHYAASQWRLLARIGTLTLGLTATPERGDGKPLGDIFEALVVTASYSELVAGQWLVPAVVAQPDRDLGNNFARDPIEAWQTYGGGAQSFIACARVDAAQEYAKRLRSLGVLAETVHAETPTLERASIMERFRERHLRVLCFVDTLTEGVDVPEVACVVLAKNFGHVSGYIQTTGRVLRPSSGKASAMVVDLCGASLRYGMPHDDRVYSLTGRAISGGGEPPPGGGVAAFSQSVVGAPLRLVGWEATAPQPVATPAAPVDQGRMRRFQQLRELARKNRLGDAWVATQYRSQFGEWPRKEWTT